MDKAEGEEADDWHLTSRMLIFNSTAIHSSTIVSFDRVLLCLWRRQNSDPGFTQTFIHALYYLVANPENT